MLVQRASLQAVRNPLASQPSDSTKVSLALHRDFIFPLRFTALEPLFQKLQQPACPPLLTPPTPTPNAV